MLMFLTLNVTNNKDMTGLPEYYRRMLPKLAKSDIDFCVFNINNTGVKSRHVFYEDYEGVSIITCSVEQIVNPLKPDIDIVNMVSRATHELDINAIIFPDYLFYPYLDLSSLRKRKIKVVLFVHLLYRGMMNAFMEYTKPDVFNFDIWPTACQFEHLAVTQSDEIWTNSRTTEEDTNRYYGRSITCDVKAIPLGINLDEWLYSPQLNETVIGYYGRLDPQKGVYSILSDLDSNLKYYQKNPLHVAGRGALEGEFLKRDYFHKTVLYQGNLTRNEVIEFLKPLKWVLIPSVYEPWGQVLTECLAMGKLCIVQSGYSGLTEQVADNFNGFHFDFKNCSVAKFIEKIESSGYDFEMISRNARNSARNFNHHIEDLQDAAKRLGTRPPNVKFTAWR